MSSGSGLSGTELPGCSERTWNNAGLCQEGESVKSQYCLVLFGVSHCQKQCHTCFFSLASLIIVGFSPLSVRRIYTLARRIHSVSSGSTPRHGSPAPTPPNGLHVWHGIPAVHHLQRQQQLRASLASAVIDPITGLGLCHNANRKGGALLPVFRQ